MYAALDIAKYVVTKCKRDGKPISNLQLQKILYYIQRDYLRSGSIAFQDSIEAWRFGPVVPKVYYYFCGAGSMPLIPLVEFEGNTISAYDKMRIDGIVEEKRKLSAWSMVSETHREGGAWDITYQNGKGYRRVIDINLIRMVG